MSAAPGKPEESQVPTAHGTTADHRTFSVNEVASTGTTQTLLTRLSRITTAGRNFIPQIDGLRFIAIMAVIAYHARGVCLFRLGFDPAADNGAGGLVGKGFEAGHFGVQLFFAISGCILSLPFARQYLCGDRCVSLRQYYVRRVTRIEPPYVIHLMCLAALCAFVLRHLPSQPQLYHNPDWAGYALSHLGASLVYANGFIFGTHPYPNYVLWSLEVEVQFYLLAPFLTKLFLLRNSLPRRILLVTSIVLLSSTGIFALSYRVWASLAGNLQFFLVGFLLTDLYVSDWLPTGRQSASWDLALILSLGAVVWLQKAPVLTFLLPCAIFVCCVAAFRGAFSSWFLRNPWVSTIGGMCYTIYLYHSLLIPFLVRLTLGLRTHVLAMDLAIQFLLLAAIVVALCAVLFAFLERPFMRRDWPQRFARKVWKTKSTAN
jgi:peptidoglycan/LPS O-acetylase OafA/YrhL